MPRHSSGIILATRSIEISPPTLTSQLATFSREPLILQSRWKLDGLAYNRAHELDQITVGRGRPVVVLDDPDECGHSDMLARLLELVLHLDKLPRKS